MSNGPIVSGSKVTVVEINDDLPTFSRPTALAAPLPELSASSAFSSCEQMKLSVGDGPEPNTNSSSDEALGSGEKVTSIVLDNEDLLVEDRQYQGYVIGERVIPGRSNRSFQLFGYGVALIFGYLLVNDLAVFVIDQFARSVVLGGVTAAILGAGFALCAVSLASEIRNYRRIASIDTPRQRISEAVLSSKKKELISLLGDVCSRIPGTAAAAASAKFMAQVGSIGEARDVMVLFDTTVMTPLDKAVSAKIHEASRQAAFFVAVSPTTITDTGLFIVRAVSMIRSIAEIYGHRPGVLGTWVLARRLCVEAGVIGFGEMAIEGAMQTVTSGILEKLSSTAAESALATQRMMRIGLMAMQLCRPVDFPKGKAPDVLALLKAGMSSVWDKLNKGRLGLRGNTAIENRGAV